jgi:dTDP-4-amino-4,6-dideoxygalactose transaminase
LSEKNKIFVTEPFLPPLEEYTELLKLIWTSKQLTNNGPFHQQFEKELANYLGVKYVSLFNNATTGLLVAIKALELKGQIITTPYSFVATAHAIMWNGLTPVFVDTDSHAGNLNPEKVEEAINDNTGGILAVHNYGIPGDVDGLQNVADKYNLPLIYDAAPTMGVKYKSKTILHYGDLAVLSFHATKIFTTFEGGAIISRSKEMKIKIDQIKNFSILDEEKIAGLGINGKMNELEAAMGLLQLKYLDGAIENRKVVYEEYENQIREINGVRMNTIPDPVEYNYAYVPIFFDNGQAIRDHIYNEMRENNIFCRKYWYPLITNHSIYRSLVGCDLPNARKLSESVLCLPIYPDLDTEDVKAVIKIIQKPEKINIE